MNPLEQPLNIDPENINSDQLQDRISEAEGPHDVVDQVVPIEGVTTFPVHAYGSTSVMRVTDPMIYQKGIRGLRTAADGRIYVTRNALASLKIVDGKAKDSGYGGIGVAAGHISYKDQQAKWQAIYDRLLRDSEGAVHTDRFTALLGERADLTGSWAKIDATKASLSARGVLESDDEAAKNSLRAGANTGEIFVPVDPLTSGTVHSAANRVNAILLDASGRPMNMGIGLDTPNETVQDIRFFEDPANVDAYFEEMRRDKGLFRYAKLLGVDPKSRDSVSEAFEVARGTRRALDHLMMDDGDFDTRYIGEGGHYGKIPEGPWNRRDAAMALRAMRDPLLD